MKTEMIRDDFRQAAEQMQRTAAEERRKNEQLARQLSREAVTQWQRSIEGLLAVPTATALGLASSTLYVAAFIERGFEVLQQTTEALRSGVEQGIRQQQRYMEQERAGDGGRGREQPRSETRGEPRSEQRSELGRGEAKA